MFGFRNPSENGKSGQPTAKRGKWLFVGFRKKAWGRMIVERKPGGTVTYMQRDKDHGIDDTPFELRANQPRKKGPVTGTLFPIGQSISCKHHCWMKQVNKRCSCSVSAPQSTPTHPPLQNRPAPAPPPPTPPPPAQCEIQPRNPTRASCTGVL